MKRISFVLLVVCLCLSAVSCKKLFHPEELYARIEGTVDGIPFYSELNDVNYTLSNPRGSQYVQYHFQREDNIKSFFYCNIDDGKYGLNLYIMLGSKDTTCFFDGKRYYYDQDELQNHYTVSWDQDNWKWVRTTENKFSFDLYGSDLTNSSTENYVRGWFQFDLIEEDGILYSLTFECENRPEKDPPFIVSGKILFYRDRPVYRNHIITAE